MDNYLPADFHALHDQAPEDWRDISTDLSSRSFRYAAKADKDVPEQAANRCVDPSWQVL
jgi:hypothetical protein